MIQYLIKESEQWVAARPFLDEIGDLYMSIYAVLDKFEVTAENIPDAEIYKNDLEKGVPILKASISHFLDFKRIGEIFIALTELHNRESLPQPFRHGCAAIKKAAAGNADVYAKLAEDAVTKNGEAVDEFAKKNNLNLALVEFLLWTAAARVISPYLKSLEEAETTWTKGYCPTCGNKPVMGRLKRTKRGRERFLSCAHCGTLWSYRRVGCPYCENDDPKTLQVIEVEEEKDIRIEVCDKCENYIKTYIDKGKNGAGGEDWASLHVDLLLGDTKYKKCGGLLAAP